MCKGRFYLQYSLGCGFFFPYSTVVIVLLGEGVSVSEIADEESALVQEDCGSGVSNPPRNFSLFHQNGYSIDWCQYKVPRDNFMTNNANSCFYSISYLLRIQPLHILTLLYNSIQYYCHHQMPGQILFLHRLYPSAKSALKGLLNLQPHYSGPLVPFVLISIVPLMMPSSPATNFKVLPMTPLSITP